MIAIEKVGTRLYLTGDTFAVKDRIKSIGGHWDGDRRAWWVGTAKATEAQKLIDGLAVAPTADAKPAKQDPSDIRLTGKGRYKGREYFAGSVTRDGTKVRLLTLPDAKGEFLDFWAPCSEVEQTKTYQPREVRRGYGRHTETVYTTLGSIADFVRKSRRTDAEIKEGRIPEGYCVDLEDGAVKRRSECDMPSD